MKTKNINKSILLLFLTLFIAVSCKTSRIVTGVKPKPIGTAKLIKNIEDNVFDYPYLGIRRITVQYESPEEKLSFRGTLKSLKDSHILVSLNKINVPVAKLLLTPDSLKLINFIEKTFLEKDFGHLSRLLNIDLDFEMVQAILSNNVLSFREDNDDSNFNEFATYIDSDFYIIQSINNRKLGKLENKGKEGKIERYLRKANEDDFIVRRLYVDPGTFKIVRVIFDDKTNDKNLRVDFSNFVDVGGKLYPGGIDINFRAPDDYLKITIKLSNFSTDYDPEINFNVPEKYKRVQ